MLVYVTTYANPKTAKATIRKSIPLMNTPFLLSLLLCGFEVNCGLNADCIIDVVGDDNVVIIDRDEDNITEIKIFKIMYYIIIIKTYKLNIYERI